MKAQLYLVEIQDHDEAYGNLAASPVYLNDTTDDIIGIVVEDLKKMGTRTICLFQPTSNPSILDNIKLIIADELPFDEIGPLINLAVENSDESVRGVRRTFWESIYEDLLSQKESMDRPPSLSDILTKRI